MTHRKTQGQSECNKPIVRITRLPHCVAVSFLPSIRAEKTAVVRILTLRGWNKREDRKASE